MKKAQELMLEYDISEEGVEIHPSDINKNDVVSQLWRDYGFKSKNFEWKLMSLIARYYNCRVIKSDVFNSDYSKSKDIKLTVVGTSKNRTIVLETYEVLVHKFLTLAHLRYSEHKDKVQKEYLTFLKEMGGDLKLANVQNLVATKRLITRSTFAGSYLIGCMSGLRSSLKSQREETLNRIGNEEHGLMVIKMDELIDAKLPELIGSVKSVNHRRTNINHAAYSEGVKDGRMNHTNRLISN